MSELVVEERRDWASDVVGVMLYSILTVLVVLLCVCVPGEPIGEHFRGDDALLRAGENEVIAGGVDSPFVFSVFIA
jgi:hypothetical protein